MRLLKKLTLICLLCSFSSIAFAGVPIVSRIEVTDLTPKSFSVCWLTSEPSTARLDIYQNNCFTPVHGLQIISKGNDSTGVLKVTVSRLSANTDYCFQTVTTSRSTGDVTIYPEKPLSVTTKRQINRLIESDSRILPFANDLLKVPDIYLATPEDTQDGILAILYILNEKPMGPLSVLMEEEHEHYFNLNNLFDPSKSENMNLVGGERIQILEIHGYQSCMIERFRKVPEDLEMTQAKAPATCFIPQDLDCNDSVNILDILRAVQWIGTSQGDKCFNLDIDLNDDNAVDFDDILSIIGNFGESL